MHKLKECLAYLCMLANNSSYALLDWNNSSSSHLIKHLVPIIGEKKLNKCQKKCQSLQPRLMPINIHIEHVIGKDLIIADVLFRIACKNNEPKLIEEDNIKEYACTVVNSAPVSDQMIAQIKVATHKDNELRIVERYILTYKMV